MLAIYTAFWPGSADFACIFQERQVIVGRNALQGREPSSRPMADCLLLAQREARERLGKASWLGSTVPHTYGSTPLGRRRARLFEETAQIGGALALTDQLQAD